MISAIKRLVNSNDAKPAVASDMNTSGPSSSAPDGSTSLSAQNLTGNGQSTSSFLNNGMHMISQSLQKKFSRGVNYNMKIVIRGDNNVGKSNLWLRLQGQPFKEAYDTSDEIKVANIQWSYKTTDDIVKVEVWDVVDRSKKKKNLTGGTTQKQKNNAFSDPYMLGAASGVVEASLDAEFIDVYKNANGCIMIFDMTKPWTWDYVERELPKVPSHIPVLVIGNFRDSQHHRAVDQLKVKYFIENLDRGNLSSSVRYTETSMRSGFGLKYLYKFFNIPFLQLQRENLMQQLETNAKEMDQISEELTAHENSMEDEYEAFTDSLNNKRRNQSEQNAKDALKNAKSVDEARKLAQEKEKAEKARALANASEPQKILQNIKTKLNAGVAGQLMPSLAESTSKNISMSVTLESHQLPNKNLSKTTSNLTNIQDFQPGPGEEDFDQFLDNSGGGFSKAMTGKSVDGMGGNRKIDREDDKENASEEEDDEDDTSFGFSSSRTGGNPMVANFKETIDSEDDDNQSSVNRRHTTISTNSETKNKSKANRFLDLSDEENERIEDKNELATVPMIQNQSASSSLAPLVPTVLEGSKAKAADSLPHSNSVSLQQFDLSSHDFDFLESITSKVASMPTKEDSVPSLSGVSSSNKKSSSKKKSSRSTGLLEETLDENETAPVKKKSSKSKSKSKDSEKREKKERKEKKSKSSAAGILEDAEERDSNIDIKQDLDYEEI